MSSGEEKEISPRSSDDDESDNESEIQKRTKKIHQIPWIRKACEHAVEENRKEKTFGCREEPIVIDDDDDDDDYYYDNDDDDDDDDDDDYDDDDDDDVQRLSGPPKSSTTASSSLRKHSRRSVRAQKECTNIYAGAKVLGPGKLIIDIEERCVKFAYVFLGLHNSEKEDTCIVLFSQIEAFRILIDDDEDRCFIALRTKEKLMALEDYYDCNARIGDPDAFIVFEMDRSVINDITDTFLSKKSHHEELKHLYSAYERLDIELYDKHSCLAGVKEADSGQPVHKHREQEAILNLKKNIPYVVSNNNDAQLSVRGSKKRKTDSTRTSKRDSSVQIFSSDLVLTRAMKEAIVAFIYPPKGCVDAVEMTLADKDRLSDGEFLNDNLINCMLKRSLEQSELNLQKVHVFSSYFFTKMIQSAGKIRGASISKQNAAVSAVRRWTKRLGPKLFDLDFLLVPINEYLHWSLAVIMYPGASPLSMTTEGERYQNNEIDLVSDDEEEHNTAEEDDDATDVSALPSKAIENTITQPTFKSPCILMLDSLRCHNVRKVSTYLRAFLKAEYKKHFGSSESEGSIEERFSSDNIPIIAMDDIPKQSNGYDCGVYLLEFASRILERGLGLDPPNLGSVLPIPKLLGDGPPFSRSLFNQNYIRGKRAEFKRPFNEQSRLYKEEQSSSTKRARTSSDSDSDSDDVVVLSGPP